MRFCSNKYEYANSSNRFGSVYNVTLTQKQVWYIVYSEAGMGYSVQSAAPHCQKYTFSVYDFRDDVSAEQMKADFNFTVSNNICV